MGVGRNKRGVGFLLFLQPKFGYLLQNLVANVFYELLEGKIVENKKTKFSHAKQILQMFTHSFAFSRRSKWKTKDSKTKFEN